MRFKQHFTLIATFLVAFAVSRAAEPYTLTTDESAAGWMLLFDGRSLNGWHIYGAGSAPVKGWHVQEGALTISKSNGRPNGGGGDLVCDPKYRDFEFSFEWRISPGGNSGVHYLFDENRSKVDAKMYAGDAGNSPIGFEYQVLDDERHPDAKHGPTRMAASIYSLVPAMGKTLRPVGEFNTGRIVVDGNHVEHWLNGVKVAETDLGSEALKYAIANSKYKAVPGFGEKIDTAIALQDHGEEVAYRNLKIRALTPKKEAATAPVSNRLPVPDAAKSAEAEKLIKDVFKNELAQTDAARRLALAKRMQLQALDIREEYATRYMLLRQALALSVPLGDVETSLRAAEDLGRLFEVSAQALSIETMRNLDAAISTPEEAKKLIHACGAFWDQLLPGEHYDAASSIIPIAESAARKAKDARVYGAVEARGSEVRAMMREFTRAGEARTAVKNNPLDADAHFALGHYLCFVRREWDAGLAELLKGNDGELKVIAAKEASKPADPKEQIDLADLWFDYAQKVKGSAYIFATSQVRAEHWYKQALSVLQGGLLKTKAEGRLAELSKIQVPEPPSMRKGNRVDVLALIDPDKDKVAGEWTRKDGALVSQSSFGARVKIPYEPPLEYDFRIEFTCASAPAQVCQVLSENGRGFSWIMGANKGRFFGFEQINGANAAKNPTTTTPKGGLEPGHKYTAVVEVRANRIRALLDGNVLADWRTNFKDMSMLAAWKLPDERSLGLGSHNCVTTFLSAEVVEIGGQGTITRPAANKLP